MQICHISHARNLSQLVDHGIERTRSFHAAPSLMISALGTSEALLLKPTELANGGDSPFIMHISP